MPNFTPSALEAALPLLAGVVAILVGFSRASGTDTAPSERAKKVLRWVGPALIAFGIFLLLASLTHRPPITAGGIVNSMKAQLSLPMRVDDDTRLDDVRALSETEIGYFLTLTTTSKAQLPGNPLAQQLQEHIKGGACQNPDYEKLLTAGISLRIAYETQDHAEVTQVVVTPADCEY